MVRVLEGPALFLVPADRFRSPMAEAAGAPFAIGLFTPASATGDGICFTLDEVEAMVARACKAGTVTADEAVELKAALPDLKQRGLFATVEELLGAIVAKATDGAEDEFRFEFCTCGLPVVHGYVIDREGGRVSDQVFTQADFARDLGAWIAEGEIAQQNGINLLAAAAGLPIREPKVVEGSAEGGFGAWMLDQLFRLLFGRRGADVQVVNVAVSPEEADGLMSGEIDPAEFIARARQRQQAPGGASAS